MFNINNGSHERLALWELTHRLSFVLVGYRLTAEVDSEELSWVQTNVDEVITMLQQSPGLPTVPEVRKCLVRWFNFYLSLSKI